MNPEQLATHEARQKSCEEADIALGDLIQECMENRGILKRRQFQTTQLVDCEDIVGVQFVAQMGSNVVVHLSLADGTKERMQGTNTDVFTDDAVKNQFSWSHKKPLHVEMTSLDVDPDWIVAMHS